MRYAARWFLALLLLSPAFWPAGANGQSHPSREDLFPFLPGLEKPVEFWKKIFTEYSVTQLVFFDGGDMSRIFEVLEVGEGQRGKDFISGERARIAAIHGVDPERIKAQRGIKERTAAGLKRAGRYLAQMQQIFKERGLPEELAYLPMVESSYDNNARSTAGALGMWQFMRSTAKQYMRVDRHIDERKDPIESTRAAAAFLSQSFQTLGNWPLAITSYNYGPAGLTRAVAQAESDNLVDLINNYSHPYWGFPPKNFYAEFLAAVEIGKNIQRYFPGLEPDSPLAIQEVEVKKGSSLAALASAKGLTREQFLEWNPALSTAASVVPAGYKMKFPADSNAATVVAMVDRRSGEPRQEEKPPMVRHRVRPGETIGQIARRYGASVEKILQVNGIRRAHLIQIGTMLLIPKI